MASRKEQKEAARQAREQAVAQLKASQTRRTRMLTLGGVLAVVVAAIIVVIVISSSGGGGSAGGVDSQRDDAPYSHAAAVADVESLLSGIPESSDNVLGSPLAPVTITEYGDLACPTCDDFAVTSEPQLIQAEVRTGKVQLIFRGDETASGYANGSEYVASQVAARAAGLQGKEWDYIMLMYDEQPQDIGGNHAEDVKYITSSYLLNRAQQVPGLNVAKWKKDLSDPALAQDVAGDGAAANAAGVSGTPTLFVSGPKGTVEYDKGNDSPSGVVPTLAELKALIAQVS